MYCGNGWLAVYIQGENQLPSLKAF